MKADRAKAEKEQETKAENLHNVSHCWLTNEEVKERDTLLRLQSDHTRWFTQQEFDRLKELSNKMFKNAGSPHCG